MEADTANGFEDGRITKAYFDRLKMIEFGCLAMSVIGIGLTWIQVRCGLFILTNTNR